MTDFRSDRISRRVALGSVVANFAALACRAQERAHTSASQALAAFGDQARQLILKTIADPSFRGRILSATVKQLMALERKTIDQLMLALHPLASACARPPLSNFLAGAVAQGSSGSLYLGANIEVPGEGLGQTVHAEQASVANAYMSGEPAVTAIAGTDAPCGHCRQFLNELSPGRDIRVVIQDKPPTMLSVLLPMPFGPKDLGFPQGAMPIREQSLSLLTRSSDPLVTAALSAARKSYAPYTASHSGIALDVSANRVFAGSYIENAAFNPSLSPLQTALAGLLAAGLEPSNIARAVLVEAEPAKISQVGVTRAALLSLAPSARFETLKARHSG